MSNNKQAPQRGEELLVTALRQYRHNSGDDSLIPGYDYDETNRIVAALLGEVSNLRQHKNDYMEAAEGTRCALIAERDSIRARLIESQANDRTAMAYLAEVRAIVGGDDFPDMVRRVAQIAQQQGGEYGDAYQGAREDLAIWKCRALEAEARVRQQDQIIDQMGEDLNAMSGPTFMGEPVLPSQRQSGVVMPERKTALNGDVLSFQSEGWNACLDEFARLNGAGSHE